MMHKLHRFYLICNRKRIFFIRGHSHRQSTDSTGLSPPAQLQLFRNAGCYIISKKREEPSRAIIAVLCGVNPFTGPLSYCYSRAPNLEPWQRSGEIIVLVVGTVEEHHLLHSEERQSRREHTLEVGHTTCCGRRCRQEGEVPTVTVG